MTVSASRRFTAALFLICILEAKYLFSAYHLIYAPFVSMLISRFHQGRSKPVFLWSKDQAVNALLSGRRSR